MGPGPAPAFPGQPMQHGYGPPSGGPSLDEVALIRKARRAPSRGWRRAVHTLSAGAINPGESQGDIEYQQLLERVNRPVRGDYRIAVLSLKGGVGKTTTTVGLGSTFASLRGDRVIAVDANPDLGTLAQRIPQQTRSTVRDLLADENVYRYSDVRAHTSQAPSRLEVLASERDPAMAEAFNEEEYRGVITVLQRFYNIIITDCGTGLSHSAMNGVLDLANTIILVSSPALDGARSAGATLDWLEARLAGQRYLCGGRVTEADGSVIPGAYTNGWIKRGPVGLIGATKSDAIETITCLLEDIEAGRLSPAPEREDDAILRLLEDRGVQYTTWDGWMALDEHEKSLGAAAVDADGEPRARIKVVEREEMVRVSREGAPQPTHA